LLFTHPRLEVEIETISGHYALTREGHLERDGKQILYYMGYGVTDRSCCGNAGCGYAVVAGVVLSYKRDVDSDGRAVSLVEPLEESTYNDVAEVLRAKEAIRQVHFLCENGGTTVLF